MAGSPEIQAAPLWTPNEAATPTKGVEEPPSLTPLRRERLARVGDSAVRTGLHEPAEPGFTTWQDPAAAGPPEVTHAARRNPNSVVRTISLDDGQQASVVVENGHIARIITSSGQVAELRWKHSPSPEHPAKPPVRVRMHAAPSPGESQVQNAVIGVPPAVSEAAARLGRGHVGSPHPPHSARHLNFRDGVSSSPSSPGLGRRQEAGIRRLHSVDAETRRHPRSPEGRALSPLSLASPAQESATAAGRQQMRRSALSVSSLEGPPDPFLTALDVPTAHEDSDMAPPVDHPTGAALTDDARDTPAKPQEAPSGDDRVTGMLRSHAVDLSPGLDWTDTGASSIEGSPTVLQQKFLASPGFPRYQGDPAHQGTMETEASLYSATSTLPSPLSSPGGMVLQSATNALQSPLAAPGIESSKLRQPGLDALDGGGRRHERTSSLRLLFEGAGTSNSFSEEASREPSGSLPRDRPGSQSVRQRIQELSAAAAAHSRPSSNLRPRSTSANNLSCDPQPPPAAEEDSFVSGGASPVERAGSRRHSLGTGDSPPDVATGVLSAQQHGMGLPRVATDGVATDVGSSGHVTGAPVNAAGEGLNPPAAGPHAVQVPAGPQLGASDGARPEAAVPPAAAGTVGPGPSGLHNDEEGVVRGVRRGSTAGSEGGPRQVVAFLEAFERDIGASPSHGDRPSPTARDSSGATLAGAGPTNRTAALPKPYSMDSWQDRAGTAGSHGDMGPGAVTRLQTGFSQIPASPRGLSAPPARLRSLTSPLEAVQSTFVLPGQGQSPRTPGGQAPNSPLGLRERERRPSLQVSSPTALRSVRESPTSLEPLSARGRAPGPSLASPTSSGGWKRGDRLSSGTEEAWLGVASAAAPALEPAPSPALQSPLSPNPGRKPQLLEGSPSPVGGLRGVARTQASPRLSLPGDGWPTGQEGQGAQAAGKKEGLLKRIKRALKPTSSGKAGRALTSSSSMTVPGGEASSPPPAAGRGAVSLRAPTSPSSLRATMGPPAPANPRSPRFSLDSRSSPRVPPGVRSPGGYPSLPSIHSSEIQPLPSQSSASPSSRFASSSRPAGESFKEEEEEEAVQGKAKQASSEGCGPWDAAVEGARGEGAGPSTPTLGSEAPAGLASRGDSTAASHSSVSSEAGAPALSRFAFSREENAAWARVWQRQMAGAPEAAGLRAVGVRDRNFRTLNAEDIEALLRVRVSEDLEPEKPVHVAQPGPPLEEERSPSLFPEDSGPLEPTAGWEESPEAGSTGDYSKETDSLSAPRRSKKREPGFLPQIVVPPPSRTGMAGRWRKSPGEGSSGEAVDELLDMSTLQRLARQRIVEMEVVETDDVFEIIWHIPLNANASKITKVERYMKDGSIVEGQRRDGRPGVLRSQLTFTQDGTPHIRSVQGEPYAAAFHDRIRMSTGHHRLKLEQKFSLLGSHAAPIKHYSIWQRVQ